MLLCHAKHEPRNMKHELVLKRLQGFTHCHWHSPSLSKTAQSYSPGTAVQTAHGTRRPFTCSTRRCRTADASGITIASDT